MAARRDPPITLSEEGGIRYLHFGSEWVQGAMLLQRPDVIVIDYVQQMMAWLLFLERPADILQLGLGAGALTRFCLRHCRHSDVQVVEYSATVIEAAHRWFALPHRHKRLRIVQTDALAHVREALPASADVIQVDLYDRHARGPTLDSLEFYERCRYLLRSPGLLVVNLFGAHESFVQNRRRLAEVFEDRLLVLPPVPAGNAVVLAFNGPPLDVSTGLLRDRAMRIAQLYGLPAPRWIEAMTDARGRFLDLGEGRLLR